MMGRRENARNHTMATLFAFILSNPNCKPMTISRGTNIPKMEVYRYLKCELYEFRSTNFLLNLRENNPAYYYHLISDARYTRNRQRRGFIINTSKRMMFEHYCFKMGYLLLTDTKNRAYLICFTTDPREKSSVLRF